MTAMILPRGSVISIEAKDLLATPAGTTKTWNKLTEHNRSEFTISPERIEKVVRTSNGTLRKNFIADKKKFSTSWSMLPSYRTLTVDGGWGAEDIRSFFLGEEGQGSFKIRVNLAKDGTNQSSSGYEEYTVVFAGPPSFTLVKRGLQPFWNVSIELDEV
jgi:hypothetical protein